MEVSNTTLFGYSVYCFNGTKVQILTRLPAVEQVNFTCWYKYKRTNTDAAACSAPDDYQRLYRQLPQSYLRHTVEVNVGRSYIYVYVYIHMYDFAIEYLEMKRCRALHIGFTLSNSRMLTYAHVCSRMFTYVHVCSRMLTSYILDAHFRQMGVSRDY